MIDGLHRNEIDGCCMEMSLRLFTAMKLIGAKVPI
jgi:hypothetical protein